MRYILRDFLWLNLPEGFLEANKAMNRLLEAVAIGSNYFYFELLQNVGVRIVDFFNKENTPLAKERRCISTAAMVYEDTNKRSFTLLRDSTINGLM